MVSWSRNYFFHGIHRKYRSYRPCHLPQPHVKSCNHDEKSSKFPKNPDFRFFQDQDRKHVLGCSRHPETVFFMSQRVNTPLPSAPEKFISYPKHVTRSSKLILRLAVFDHHNCQLKVYDDEVNEPCPRKMIIMMRGWMAWAVGVLFSTNIMEKQFLDHENISLFSERTFETIRATLKNRKS